MININNRTVTKITIALWIIIAALYLKHTPLDHRNHDYVHHLYHTEVIVAQHRLPNPYEALETYQPPLYYLINSLVVPQSLIEGKKEIHGYCVKSLSIIYGAIAIFLLSYLLKGIIDDPNTKLLSLLFLITTPTFVFIFSTYSNDSLATLLAMAIIVISYKLYKNWTKQLARLLLLISIAAVYTKLTTIFCMITIFLICFISCLITRKLPDKKQIGLVTIFFIAIISLIPWMTLHNYPNTGRLTPTNTDYKIDQDLTPKNYLKSIFAIMEFPFTKKRPYKWDDPWVHTMYDPPQTKGYDYWSTSFITSIIGEYIFTKPDVAFVWFIYWAHLFVYVIALIKWNISTETKLATMLVILCHFVYLSQIGRVAYPIYPAFLDFRLICWSWVGWLILYTNVIKNSPNLLSSIIKKVFALTIVVQIYLLLIVEGGFW